MAKYFFFDGEYAETFSSETNSRAVGQAVRDMLGCNVIEAAIDDLEYAAKQYGAQLADIPGEAELTSFAARLKDLEDKLQYAMDGAAGTTAEKDRLDDQIQEITEKLRDAEAAKHLQRAREEKERSPRNVQDRIRTAEQNVVKWVRTKTLSLVSRKLASETLSFID
jgi:DNA sulfur modification protein DndD